MKDVCETLFEPLTQALVQTEGRRVLFLNAHATPFLMADFILQQGFKPFVDALGGKATPEIPEGEYDVILHLFPKNITEGKFEIARGLQVLRKGGILVCAADNKAGGSRLEKIFSEFGISDIQNTSKNKARVVWGRAENLNREVLEKSLAEGAVQSILGGEYQSQPGVFGWDKIDQGSALLARVLPKDLKGKGADFGCGYGYLSRQVLEKCHGVSYLSCVDADYRAVELCRNNLKNFSNRPVFLWRDLIKAYSEKNLDFIVMNPPFHEGKKTDVGVGADFIKNAAQSLRGGGTLWMVSNTHLPYEAVLNTVFSEVVSVANEKGFKVLKAVK